ncbi:MAG TPA: ABC transporter ATP-binding protein [Vicinamibacterales bacterium]|nr:ABC transporter ATP-binding protein [Vicinamibacterales bacterium]
MLRASDVWFAYDRTQVLRGVGLAVPAGAIVGILGPNGSGKTTLLRVLAGTRRPQRGSVTLDGAPLTSFSRAGLARRMAAVPQETHLAFDYTVAEVAMMGRYPHLGAFEIEGPSDVAVTEEMLAATGTLHLKERLFATLSGGEKQRVVIAAALAQIETRRGAGKEADGGLLLLDEPTASLDLKYQLEIAALLRRLHDERGLTILISTHDLGLAGTLCEALLMIRGGEVVADGDTDRVLSAPNIRAVFDVDAEVIQRSGRRIVVPLR